MISRTGSGRSTCTIHSPSERRGTCRRKSLPIRYRSSRDVERRRKDAKASLSAEARTT
jgi:hypothetical protein